MKIDKTDRLLLQALQEDAKTKITELEKLVNLSKTPIYDRLKRYDREQIIDRYVAILNPKVWDHQMVVFCSVSLESQKIDALEAFNKAIEALPEVVECYLMGGANDYLLKVIVKDLAAYHQFSSGKLAALDNVAQIKSTFVLDEVKRSTVVPMGS